MSSKTSKAVWAFSLVEVVMAIGIMSFSLVALLGLLSVGLGANEQSIEKIRAANIVTSILGERRMMPSKYDSAGQLIKDTNGNPTAFKEDIIPSLRVDSLIEPPPLLAPANLWIDENGNVTADIKRAAYRVAFRVQQRAIGSMEPAVIHLTLSWPPEVASSKDSYEIVTCVRP